MSKSKTRMITMMLLVAMVALILPTQSLLAAPPSQAAPADDTGGYRLICEDGVCSVSLGLEQATAVAPELAVRVAPSLLRAAQDNIEFLPDELELAVTDQVTLTLPVGAINMLDADLQVALDDEQRIESFYGTASVPFPTLGLFPGVELVLPGQARVGFDTGENLAFLGAPLDPDQRYFVVHFGGDDPDTAQKATFDFTGEEGQNSLTLIIDPTTPFVYLVGNVLLVDVSEFLLADQIAGGAMLPMIPNFLPVPERVGGRVALLVTDDLDEFNFEIGGGYAVDSGSLARRLGIDIKPIAIEGVVSLTSDGLTLNGVTQSSLASGALFDSEGRFEVNIPFTGDAEDAYAQVSGSVESPIVGLERGGEADANLAEFSQQLKESEGAARMAWLRTRMASAVSGTAGQVGGVVGSGGQAVSGAASSAANMATDILSGTVSIVTSIPVTDAISNTVSSVAGVVPEGASDGVSTSVDWAARVAGGAYNAVTGQVCNWFGRCVDEQMAQGE